VRRLGSFASVQLGIKKSRSVSRPVCVRGGEMLRSICYVADDPLIETPAQNIAVWMAGQAQTREKRREY
jgi:hypothetical protein